MFAIDTERMALNLGETAVNEGTQDFSIAYRLHHTDGTLNLSKSFFDFSSKISVEFYSELNSLSNSM